MVASIYCLYYYCRESDWIFGLKANLTTGWPAAETGSGGLAFGILAIAPVVDPLAVETAAPGKEAAATS